MKMLPAGGTKVTGRRESTNVGEMKLRKLSKKKKKKRERDRSIKRGSGKLGESRK